jgi:hypothetical protein
MDVDIKAIGLIEQQARLTNVPTAADRGMRSFVRQGTDTLREMVKQNISDRFHSTGPLYQSVRSAVTETADTITGSVVAGLPPFVAYAAAQEYGVTIQIPEISPVRAQALAFMGGGRMGFSSGGGESGMVFAKRVRAHPVTLPERSYARTALADFRQPFRDGIRAIVQSTLDADGAQYRAVAA